MVFSRAIRPHDLAEVLKDYQNIAIKLDKQGDTIMGYTIYDKSGYVFMERELGQNIRMEKRLDIFGNGDEPTEIDTDSRQFRLEIQKLIKEAFQTSYLKSSKQNRLFSESISAKNLNSILLYITQSKGNTFLESYLSRNRKESLRNTLEKEFQGLGKDCFNWKSKREKKFWKVSFS